MLGLPEVPGDKARRIAPTKEHLTQIGDRSFKLAFGTTSGYGRYVQPLWGGLWWGRGTQICVMKSEIPARKLRLL